MTRLPGQLSRSLPVVIIATGAMCLSAAGGAVAGSMITGANIKDGTVTTADIKNGTVSSRDVRDGTLRLADIRAAARDALQGEVGPQGPQGPFGPPGVSGYEQTNTAKSVPANTPTQLSGVCPGTKKLLAATGYWVSSNEAVQIQYVSNNGASAFTDGVTSSDALHLQLICANVS